MSTPDEALAAALPCQDPEESCDADGRDEHWWCDNCIARGVLSRQGYAIVRSDELAGLRRAHTALSNVLADIEEFSDSLPGSDRAHIEQMARSALEGVSR